MLYFLVLVRRAVVEFHFLNCSIFDNYHLHHIDRMPNQILFHIRMMLNFYGQHLNQCQHRHNDYLQDNHIGCLYYYLYCQHRWNICLLLIHHHFHIDRLHLYRMVCHRYYYPMNYHQNDQSLINVMGFLCFCRKKKEEEQEKESINSMLEYNLFE